MSLLFIFYVFIYFSFPYLVIILWFGLLFHISWAQDRPAFGTGKGNGAKKLLYTTILVIPLYFAGRSGMVGLGSRDVVIPFSGLRETNTASPVLIGVSLLYFFLFFLFYFTSFPLYFIIVHFC